MKLVAPVLALFTTAFAFVAPAVAAAAPADHTVRADLNGDGTLDRVVVKAVPGNEFEQSVVATVGRTNYVARTELYSPAGVQPPRVVDVNGDGRDEVLVTESVGANTDRFTLWGVSSRGWAPVVHAGAPDIELAVWEGGAATHFDRYGCEANPLGGRGLVWVYASSEDGETFFGERVTHNIQDGWVTATSRTSVSGPRESSVWRAEPQNCA